MNDETYDTRGEAIVAALDELEPGYTLWVHKEECELAQGQCTCTPESWEY